MQQKKSIRDNHLLDAYDYHLPPQNIAQHPAENRDNSKLLIITEREEAPRHAYFRDIVDYFHKGDVLVVNNTKVFPARLLGHKESGGKAEVFLLGLPMPTTIQPPSGKCYCEALALIKSSKRPKIGSIIKISNTLSCIPHEYLDDGKVKVILQYPEDDTILDILEKTGSVPLPPYIERNSGTTAADRNRYQTVYAAENGAVAAPTAGLHFTEEILQILRDKGIKIVTLTLHVGYGTFAPVRCEDITTHQIHSEYIAVSKDTAETINKAKQKGGKIWAVGTTTVRALEFCATPNGEVEPSSGWCDLYIIPGYRYRVIDNLITNFHLPKSSLLFLVSALCGREKLLEYYKEAIAHDYRFYSYGDAMAIIR